MLEFLPVFRKDVPDGKGFGLIGLAFFAAIVLVSRLDFVGGSAAEFTIGLAVSLLIMIAALWIVKALAWTRPRRDDEWL
ncbi:MAG: hypothetical protein AAF311_11830 [Pseudomonadota bacterium]